jgi:uncharacterized protein
MDTLQAQQSTLGRGVELVQAALERTLHPVIYDGSYRSIPYPLGDVPDDVGVCTDVIVRSYRVLGIDLQQRVHDDMKSDFAAYPAQWGLRRPDANIDHRRVPNIRRFLERQGASLAITMEAKDYLPGDLVTYNLLGGPQGTGNLPHIGIVSSTLSDEAVPLLVHNIGGGPRIEDVLFDYPITGHYRYLPVD